MSNFLRMMYGRYGVDNLSKFLFCIYIIIFIIGLFFKNFILDMIGLLLLFIVIFRFFSKNIYKRSKENQIYLKIKNKTLKPFKNIKRNFNERNEHVYKKCHKCKTTLKLPLPYERGIKHAKCPTCKNKITFLCLRKQKIEIITDNERMKK